MIARVPDGNEPAVDRRGERGDVVHPLVRAGERLCVTVAVRHGDHTDARRAARLHVHLAVADVERVLAGGAEPGELGAQDAGIRLLRGALDVTSNVVEDAREQARDERLCGAVRFVAEHAERDPAPLQRLEMYGEARVRLRVHTERHRIGRGEGVDEGVDAGDVGRSPCPGGEVAHAAADVLAIRLEGDGRKAVAGERFVHARRDVGEGVDERSVEVEEDRRAHARKIAATRLCERPRGSRLHEAMTRATRRDAWLVALGLALAVPGPASAQEWGLTRSRGAGGERGRRAREPRVRTPATQAQGTTAAPDRDAVLLERYLGIVLADPQAGFALDRLVELRRTRDGGLEGLRADLTALTADPVRGFAAHMVLGHLAHRSGLREDALRAYQAAAQLRPEDATALVAIGRVLGELGRPDAASYLERALDRMPNGQRRDDLVRELGRLAIARQDYDAARALFDRLARGGNAWEQAEYARALRDANQHARAAAELTRLLGLARGDARATAPLLRDLGRAQLDIGDVDTAIETLARARAAATDAGLVAEIDDLRVEVHRRAGRLDALAAELAARGSSDPAVAALLGRLYDELGDTERALEQYRKAARGRPRDVDLLLQIAQLASRAGRLDEVVATYRELVRIAPRDPRFVVELAELLVQVGRPDEARRVAVEAGRRAPTDAAIHAALVDLYERFGDHEAAVREIETLVRIDPSEPSHLVALGTERLGAGDRAAALATFRRVAALARDPGEAAYEVGAILADHDLVPEAEAELRRALTLRPSHPDVIRRLAGVLEMPRANERVDERRARDAEALRLYGALLEVPALDATARREARRRIVALHERLGTLETQLATWERDFAAEPPTLDAGYMLVEAYARRRPPDVVAVERALARIAAVRPGDVDTLQALERSYVLRGDRARAITTLEQLVEADPTRAVTYLERMAEHALALYRDADAVRYAEEAVRRRPDDAAAHVRLGDLHRARHELDAAADRYRRAIALDDRLFGTFLELAQLEAERGRVEAAAPLYMHVIRASPDDDLVSRAAIATRQLHVAAGRLEALERDLLPVVVASPRRRVLRRILVELYELAAMPHVRVLTSGVGDAATARAALTALGTRGIKPLLDALADTDGGQRRIAIEVLAHARPAAAVEPLLAVAESDAPVELRLPALVAAGRYGDARYAARFLALAAGTERRLRVAATWAFVMCAPASEAIRLRALLTDTEVGVRTLAALGAGRLGDQAAVPQLTRMVREERGQLARAAAAWALGALRAPATVELRNQLARPGLPRLAAMISLGRVDDAESRPTIAALALTGDAEERAFALAALSNAGRPAEALPSDALEVTAERFLEAVLTRARVETPTASPDALAPALAAALDRVLEGPSELARAALESLAAEPAHPRLVPGLARASTHPDPVARLLAVRALARIDDAAAREALRARLEDRDGAVLRECARAVEGDPQATSQLVALVAHADWTVRLAVVTALSASPEPSATEALVLAARDETAFVREQVARALASRPEASETLAALASDPEPRVREAARGPATDR